MVRFYYFIIINIIVITITLIYFYFSHLLQQQPLCKMNKPHSLMNLHIVYL